MKEVPIAHEGHPAVPGELVEHVSEHVAQNIETIASLHAESEGKVGKHQRIVERLTAAIAHPWAVAVIVGMVALWVVLNLLAPSAGIRPIDRPPFAWLQGVVSLCALLMTAMVLTTQSRLAKRAYQRENLELQVNLLAEQKVAKIIALLEELRRDLPSVKDRVDPVAEAMSEAVDPHAVFTALDKVVESVEQSLEGDVLEKGGGGETGKPETGARAAPETGKDRVPGR